MITVSFQFETAEKARKFLEQNTATKSIVPAKEKQTAAPGFEPGTPKRPYPGRPVETESQKLARRLRKNSELVQEFQPESTKVVEPEPTQPIITDKYEATIAAEAMIEEIPSLPVTPAKKITKPEIIAAIKKMVNVTGMPKTLELLKSFGAENASTLVVEKYGEFISAVDKEMGF